MIHRILLIAVLIACALSLLGCASTTPPPAPQSNVQPTAAPAAGRTSLPLPPQPTSPPPATGIASPFQTAVPAPIVSGPTPIPPTNTRPAPTTVAATVLPTNTPSASAAGPTAARTAATPAPTAPGIATGKRTEVKFSFTPPLATIEDAEPLDLAIKKLAGIFEVSSGQTTTTVTYDAGLITVDQIIAAFALQGHPVKLQ